MRETIGLKKCATTTQRRHRERERAKTIHMQKHTHTHTYKEDEKEMVTNSSRRLDEKRRRNMFRKKLFTK